MNKLLFIISICWSVFLHAEEHGMTSIVGNQIQLQFHDHGIAGSIKDRLVFGSQFNDKFGSSMIIRDNRKKQYTAEFKKVGDYFVGHITSSNAKGEVKTTTIGFIKNDPENYIVHLNINGTPTEAQIEFDSLQGGHFINPKYSLEYQGEKIAFKVTDGSACWGCSVNLLFMIVGAYVH